MPEQLNSEQWQISAALYELLALGFRYPEPLLAEVLVSGEWIDAANEIAAATGLNWQSSATDEAERFTDADSALHALRLESTRLFFNLPDAVVSPYEGIWRAADDGVEGLLFVNPSSMDVERFCRACGLGQPQGKNDPLDFIATELELLEYLAARAAFDASAPAVPEGQSACRVEGCVADREIGCKAEGGAGCEGNGCGTEGDGSEALLVASRDLPGGSAAAAFELFMDEHARCWMPRFAARTQQESQLPFYRQAASLLAAAIADE